MSLELALQQATAAFQLNTALLQQLIAILVAENAPAITAAAAEDLPKAKRTKKEAAPVEPVGEPVQEPTAPSPASTATAASETVAVAPAIEALDYDAVLKVLTALAKSKGSPAVFEILLDVANVKNLKLVDLALYPEIVARAQRAMV